MDGCYHGSTAGALAGIVKLVRFRAIDVAFEFRDPPFCPTSQTALQSGGPMKSRPGALNGGQWVFDAKQTDL